MNKVKASAEKFTFSEKEKKELEKASEEIIVPEIKKLLVKNFDPLNYTDKALSDMPIEFMIYWSLSRDCLVQANEEKVIVAWRVRNLDKAPKLKSIKTSKKDYTFEFTFDEKLGQKLTVLKKDYRKFLKKYENEIREIKEKFSA